MTELFIPLLALTIAVSSHGHPLGGGSWWVDGNRTIMGRIHDALSARGVAITSEGANECYLDVIDGQQLACRPQAEAFYTFVGKATLAPYSLKLIRE